MEAAEEGPGTPTRVELRLPRTPQAPAIARAAVSGICERIALEGARSQTLLLLVSEIVTNAVVHSDGPAREPIVFLADVDGEAVRIAVADGGSGFEPRAREPAGAAGGWGLSLVQREARRWGIETGCGTRVWFEFPRSD
jgi:anti-sigma regulatory factor (Ser/Thr protein kinase)